MTISHFQALFASYDAWYTIKTDGIQLLHRLRSQAIPQRAVYGSGTQLVLRLAINRETQERSTAVWEVLAIAPVHFFTAVRHGRIFLRASSTFQTRDRTARLRRNLRVDRPVPAVNQEVSYKAGARHAVRVSLCFLYHLAVETSLLVVSLSLVSAPSFALRTDSSVSQKRLRTMPEQSTKALESIAEQLRRDLIEATADGMPSDVRTALSAS